MIGNTLRVQRNLPALQNSIVVNFEQAKVVEGLPVLPDKRISTFLNPTLCLVSVSRVQA